jgi:hypothetical protein
MGMTDMSKRMIGKQADCIGADADILSVEGLVVDSVNAIGRVFHPEYLDGIEGIGAIVQKVLVCRILQGSHTNKALARLSLLDLGLVIVGGSSFDPQPTQPNMSQSDNFPQFIQAISQIAWEFQDSKKDYDFAELKSILEDPTFSRCVWAIKYACLNRRLFTTANGHVGLGPQAIREDDFLCILADSRLPIMLRQCDTEWNVLGPCFAHGIMRGEVVKERLEAGDASVNFDLR